MEKNIMEYKLQRSTNLLKTSMMRNSKTMTSMVTMNDDE